MTTTNITEIEIIENLMNEAQSHVECIDAVAYPQLAAAKSQLYESINSIQEDDLHLLRDLCEE